MFANESLSILKQNAIKQTVRFKSSDERNPCYLVAYSYPEARTHAPLPLEAEGASLDSSAES